MYYFYIFNFYFCLLFFILSYSPVLFHASLLSGFCDPLALLAGINVVEMFFVNTPRKLCQAMSPSYVLLQVVYTICIFTVTSNSKWTTVKFRVIKHLVRKLLCLCLSLNMKVCFRFLMRHKLWSPSFESYAYHPHSPS